MIKITHLNTKNIFIMGNTTMIDWQEEIGLTEITVAKDSKLHYFLIQGLDNYQERDITFSLHENSSAEIYGLSLGSGNKELILNLTVDHTMASSKSNTVIKGLFTDHSKGVLNGMIKIRKEAKLAEAKLSERILLTSKKAIAEAIPNLEIKNDEVIASHAATVSSISEEEIFYLQTRGIALKEAYINIINAFLKSQFNLLPQGIERDKLESSLDKRLQSFKYESIS